MEKSLENKKNIGLIADEMGDLPEDMITANEVSIVKFKIDYGELESFPGNVYQKIREGGKRGLPSLLKTSQPSINDFLKIFKEKLQNFEKVICVTFSSKISGAYNSAVQAIKFLPATDQKNIYVLDSLQGSGAEGLIILKVAEMIKEAKLKFEEIIEEIQKNLNNFRLVATYDKPKWIEASGRLPKFLPLALNQAEIRNIKPIFTIKNGKLSIIGIKKNINGLGQAIFEEFKKQTTNITTKIKVAINHADNPEQAERLKGLIKTLPNCEIAYVNLACFTIGSHTGPGTMILSWQQ